MYFLGSITGASGSYYNQSTGNSGIGTFTIPPTVKALYLVPSASGLLFELSAATGITAFTNITRGAQLSGPGTINGPFRAPGADNIQVGICHNQAGFISCRIYGAPTA